MACPLRSLQGRDACGTTMANDVLSVDEASSTALSNTTFAGSTIARR
jgi:hypothetical protein